MRQRAWQVAVNSWTLTGFVIFSSLALPAVAQDRPLRLSIDTSVVWEANVFRLPDSITDPQLARGLTGRSDRISTTRVGIHLDKTYSQQRITFDAEDSAIRYEKFAFLNRNAFNYRGAWQWHVTPRISGTLAIDQSETLVGFDDTRVLARNVRITRNKAVTVDGWLSGGWHLLAEMSEAEIKSTTAFAAQPDFTQTSGGIGLKYLAGSGNFLSLTQRARQGSNTGQAVDLVTFVDSGFTVRETELAAVWNLNGKSSLIGHFTRISRHHEHVPQRNFSGYAGDLSYVWTPTGKLTVNAVASRNLIPFSADLQTSYKLDNTLSVSPVWALSSRTSISLAAFRRTSDFLGPVISIGSPQRRDTLQSVQLAASWSPHPKINVRASVQRDRRRSTDSTFDYDDALTNLTMALTF